MTNKDKGELVEQIVITELMKLGIPVSKPIGDNKPYDIIIDLDNELKKVQIRTCWKQENKNSLKIPFLSSRMNTKGIYKTSNKDKVDYYIGYSFHNDKCYLIDTSKIVNKNCIYLQLNDNCKNGRVINFAKDYELSKII